MRLENSLRWLFVSLSAMIVAACGGSSTTNLPPSGLKKRVLLSNPFGNARVVNGLPTTGIGAVDIMDAVNDKFVSPTPLTDIQPALSLPLPSATQLAAAGGTTAVVNGDGLRLDLIDNAKEKITQEASFNDRIQDVVVTSDGQTVYAAVRNTGQVAIVSAADGSVHFILVPSVRRLVLSPKGTRLLAFSDDINTFAVIDTATNAVTTVNLAGLDRPLLAIFNGSETRAFILNCGAECGGTTASVALVDFSGAPAVTASVAIPAATIGVINGSTLYVAGTPVGGTSGTLQAISTATLTASASISIGNGFHRVMRFINNHLYIGSSGCTTSEDSATGMTRGCLTIFDASTTALKFPEFSSLRSNFDVTAIQAISGRDVVYVCEGGELDIFDSNAGTFTPSQVSVVGKATDVVLIDP